MTTKRAAGARTTTAAKKAAATKRPPPTAEQRIAKLERENKKLRADLNSSVWLLAELLQKLREAAIQQLLANPQVQQMLAQRAMAQAQLGQQPQQPPQLPNQPINPLIAQLLSGQPMNGQM